VLARGERKERPDEIVIREEEESVDDDGDDYGSRLCRLGIVTLDGGRTRKK
jgi:hypothetical protein